MLAVHSSQDVQPTYQWLRDHVDRVAKVDAFPAREREGTGSAQPMGATESLGDLKVAMIVFNTCHADARVLRQAGTLVERGARVRIFAVANSSYPPGTETLANGVQIQRVAVRSAFNLAFVWLALGYHALRRTKALARRRERQSPQDPVLDLRTRQERREALHRLPKRSRLKRSLRLYVSHSGTRYRQSLRRAYLVVHRGLGRWLRPVHRPTQQVSFWMNVRDAIEAWSPEVVHAHDANTLVPGGLVSSSLGVPLVYDSHELWRHRNRGDRRAPVGRVVDALIEAWGARQADAVISVSPGLVSWLEEKYRLHGRVHLLRNTPSRVAATEAPSLREMAELGPDDRIVLYTGRITTGRGIEEAIEAISLMPDDVHLVMLGYGDPEYLAELRDHARRHGMTERFRHVGAVPHEQVSSTAAEADVSVVAVQPTCLSYLHSLPNKLFEAIQAGLPIVASRLPDVQELMEHHGIGETFAVGDPKDMRRALSQALKEPHALKANVRRAAEVLCWEVERERLIDVYAEILAGPGDADIDDWDELFRDFTSARGGEPGGREGTPSCADTTGRHAIAE